MLTAEIGVRCGIYETGAKSEDHRVDRKVLDRDAGGVSGKIAAGRVFCDAGNDIA